MKDLRRALIGGVVVLMAIMLLAAFAQAQINPYTLEQTFTKDTSWGQGKYGDKLFDIYYFKDFEKSFRDAGNGGVTLTYMLAYTDAARNEMAIPPNAYFGIFSLLFDLNGHFRTLGYRYMDIQGQMIGQDQNTPRSEWRDISPGSMGERWQSMCQAWKDKR